jgi:hypothetical protein
MKPNTAGAVGALVGALQTPLVREYVDRKRPLLNVPQLKAFGTPSALAGIGLGGISTLVAALSLRKGAKKLIKEENIPLALDYGVVALTTGVLSGLFPAVTAADCTAAGGYYYNGACHKTPATGTVSMNQANAMMPGPGPFVPSVRYMPPPHATPSRFNSGSNVMEQMTSEIQRLSGAVTALSQENSQLRSMGTTYPGQPTPALREYGFMGPGNATPRDGNYGFMDTGVPLAKIQTMKSRFGFLG